MRSVVKHSYIKGSKGKSRAKAHVNYIAHRSGPDRESGARDFFDKKRDDISAREVRQDIDAIERAQVVAHKIILSPGVPGVDIQAYTREVMQAVGRRKGLDLDWRGVVHTNTANHHAHVVVFGKDLNGIRVRLDLNDCKFMRLAGDRYLERVHDLDRYLTKDEQLRKVLELSDFEREGDPLFQGLIRRMIADAREEERKKRDDEVRELDEHRLLDDLLGQTYRNSDERLRKKGKEQRMHEGRGRLTDAHLDYQDAMEKKRLDDLVKANPEQRPEVERQLAELREESQERLANASGWKEFDALLGEHWQSVDKTLDPQVENRQVWQTPLSDRDPTPSKEISEDHELNRHWEMEEEFQRADEERHFQDLHIRQRFFDDSEPEREDWDDRDLGPMR